LISTTKLGCISVEELEDLKLLSPQHRKLFNLTFINALNSCNELNSFLDGKFIGDWVSLRAVTYLIPQKTWILVELLNELSVDHDVALRHKFFDSQTLEGR